MRLHERKGILAVLVPLSFLACPAFAGESVTPAASGARIDYVAQLNELVRKGSDESQNAEPFYRRAFALYVESPTGVDGKEIVCWPTELTEERQAALRKWVEANSEALVQLRLGTEKPSYWFEYKGDRVLTADRFSDMPRIRLLLWALVLRAKFEATKGNTKDALGDVMAACRFALDMRKRLLLVDQLVGLGASVYALRATYQIVDKNRPNYPLLQAMQNQLMDLARDRSCSIDLKGEELAVLDTVQSVYTHYRGEYKSKSMGWVDRILLSQVSAKLKADFGIDLTPDQLRSALLDHTPQELTDAVKKGYAYYASVISKTPFQWRKEAIDFDEKQQEFVRGNLLLSTLAPAVPSQVHSSSRCRAERDGLITVLALLRYRNDKNVFPIDLERLVSAGYLRGLPMDPYSDKPLVYKRTENSFVLYSVGADFQDNGGRPDPKWGQEAQGGDFVFWPVQNESPRK